MSSSNVSIWRWRLFLAWLFIPLAATLVGFAARPLQNLGYEFALYIALITGLGAGHLAAHYPGRIRAQLARFPGARLPVLVMYTRALAFCLPLLVPPLAAVLLSLPIAIRLARVTPDRDEGTFVMLDGKTAQLHMAFGVLTVVGFLVRRWL